MKFRETPAKATGAAVSPVTNIANDGPVLFGCFIDKFDNTTCKIFLKDTQSLATVGLTNQHPMNPCKLTVYLDQIRVASPVLLRPENGLKKAGSLQQLKQELVQIFGTM